MKRGERLNVRLSEAVNLLVSYQAYCLRTGCEHLSFAEALDNKEAMKTIEQYRNMLNDPRHAEADNDRMGYMDRIIHIMPHTMTGVHLAYTFIVLNSCLLKAYERMCILSWYDMQTIINVVGRQRETVWKIKCGEIRSGEVDHEYAGLIRKILVNSIHRVDVIRAWADRDHVLQPVALWLLTDRCAVDDNGIMAMVVHNGDNALRTKLMPKIDADAFKAGDCDYLDKVASLLYSLPVIGAPTSSIPDEETFDHISEFIRHNANKCGFIGDYASMAYADNHRALKIKDVCFAVHYSKSIETAIISMAGKGWAYVLHVDGHMLMSCNDLYTTDDKSVKDIGRAIDSALSDDAGRALCMLISQLFEKPVTELSYRLADSCI